MPLVALVFAMAVGMKLAAQQVPDTLFIPTIRHPTFSLGTGPTILVDESHRNFHTMAGTYSPFARFLKRDGYVLMRSATRVSTKSLGKAGVFVTVSARKPFAQDEIAALVAWIKGGGALLLIVDHPPFVDSSIALAEAVGVRLHNVGARDPDSMNGRLMFRRADQTLLDHQVTRGIDSVATFLGAAFDLLAAGDPLLVFKRSVRATTEPNDTTAPSLEGRLQGAVLEFGAGRVAVFAEAAMFTAQLSGPDRSPMGMNASLAQQNAYLLLNVMHWLSRVDK